MFTKLVITNPSLTIDTSLPEGSGNYPNLLCENPTYTHCINSDENLEPGQAASAQLVFTVDYSGYSGTQISKNSVITYYTLQPCDNGVYRQMGIFRVDEITKNRNKYTIVAYDNIIKFDRDVTSFLENSPATTLYGLFTGLCTYCGVSYYNSSFHINTNMTVTPKDLIKTGISGRTVLQYIAQAVGCYAFARPNGTIHIAVYGNTLDTPTIAVTDADYEDLDIAELPCPRITSVAMNNQTEVVYGRGNSSAEVQIIYNPLFYTRDPSDIQQAVQNIYNQLNIIKPYYACSFKMFDDKKINAGDLITVDGKRVLVFSKTLSDSGCNISCTGATERLPQVITSSQMIDRQEAYQDSGPDISITNKYINYSSSHIYMDDLYLPGIGYDENPNNNSLVNVINYLLLQGGHKTTPTTEGGSATFWRYPTSVTNYKTSEYGASITSGNAITLDGSGEYWTYTAANVGKSEITITQSVSGISYPVVKIEVYVYDNVYPTAVLQQIDYSKANTDYTNIKLKAYWGGNLTGSTWILVGDSDDNLPSGCIDNGAIMWEFADDYLNLELKANGWYKILVYDREDHGPLATWYLLSSTHYPEE